MKMITIRNYLTIACLLCALAIQAQNTYQLSAFKLLTQVEKADTNQRVLSKGISVEFRYLPLAIHKDLLRFEVQLWSLGQEVARGQLSFEYQVSDSLVQLIDSLGIDSIPNLDTLLSIYIPYRSIALEQGMHDVEVKVSERKRTFDLFQRKARFEQGSIYDVFLDLKAATLSKGDHSNPIGLHYYAPDPQWQLILGQSDFMKGPVQRNSFILKDHKFQATCTDDDALAVCVYDTDPLKNERIACLAIPNKEGPFQFLYEDTSRIKGLENMVFTLKKLERKPLSTSFEASENYLYKGVRGLKIDFSYDLPLYYKRKSIRVQLMNEAQLPIKDWITIQKDRKQIEHRIVAQYRYFIPNTALKNVQQVLLQLKANDIVLQVQQSAQLSTSMLVDAEAVQQQSAFVHNGVSGILYDFNFRYTEPLPAFAQIELRFPSLQKHNNMPFLFWEADDSSNIQSGQSIDLTYDSIKQQFRVFVPYYILHQSIHLSPQLILKTPFYKNLLLHQFSTNPYQKPMALNDIQLQAKGVDQETYQGLAGQRFVFDLLVPDYYHSKGTIELNILEDDRPYDGNYFISNKLSQKKSIALFNQQQFELFIPMRWMKKGKKYRVQIQAKNQSYAISELRTLQYVHQEECLQKVQLYVENLWMKEVDSARITLGIRNNKDFNATYENLSYRYIGAQVYISSNQKQAHRLFECSLHPQDEIYLWIEPLGDKKHPKKRWQTSISDLEEQSFQVKKEDFVKLLSLKKISNIH